MKHFFVILILTTILGLNNSLAQIPITDAIELRNLLNRADEWPDNDSTKKRVTDILSYYCKRDDINQDFLTDNPFIADFALNWTNKSGSGFTGGFNSSSLFSSIGGLDVTNIADGLAKFLVKRAKQELSMAFFDKLKKVIDSTQDLQTLFPQTSELLSAMGEEVYNYEAYIQNLREAFKEDINSLPQNFPGIIDNHKDNFFNNKNQELEVALRTACYIANALQEQTHPGDILDNFPIEYLDILPSRNYKGAIQTLQLISASLKDTANNDSASYWVNLKKLRELVNEKVAFKIYFGLIYQKAKKDSIMFDGNYYLTTLLDKAAANFGQQYNAYKKYIQEFGVKLDALNKMVKNYDKPATDSLTLELYAKYFKASVDMIEYCTSIGDLPHFTDSKIGSLRKDLKPYFNIAFAAVDLTTNINRRNYSAAVNKAVYIYNEIVVKKYPSIAKNNNLKKTARKVNKIKKLSFDISIGANEIVAKADSTSKKLHLNPKRTLLNFVKYGSFMANVATAKNSDEVSAAIEAFALPAGSSRIKRRTDFNVSLNAYVGLFVGMEKIKSVDSSFKPNTFGVYAPVGISISRGNISLGKWKGHSISLFVSAFDLGAVTSFRFKDDSTEKAPTIQLKDIFAPGLNLSFGFANSPISLSVGWQMGPRLRGVTPAANEFASSKYSRIGIGLSVDIPLLNFYTKSK